MVKQSTFDQNIFADSLLQSSWAQRSRRSLSTLTSFGMQAIVIGLIILLSLLKSVMMPTAQTVSTPITMSRPAPEPLASHSHGGSTATTPINSETIILQQPSSIPHGIQNGADRASPEPSGPDVGPYGPGVTSNGPGFPISSLFNGTRPVPVPAPQPVVRQFRTSDLLEGSLIRRVQPVYPPLARSARIQGQVVLAAVISKAGTIDNLHVLSGHPMLIPAAIAAVSQWRYRPYILNSEPIEVETQITVNFSLGGN
jgi:periplasmic protein TonB